MHNDISDKNLVFFYFILEYKILYIYKQIFIKKCHKCHYTKFIQ
jgi:hypothetical protein